MCTCLQLSSSFADSEHFVIFMPVSNIKLTGKKISPSFNVVCVKGTLEYMTMLCSCKLVQLPSMLCLALYCQAEERNEE